MSLSCDVRLSQFYVPSIWITDAKAIEDEDVDVTDVEPIAAFLSR